MSVIFCNCFIGIIFGFEVWVNFLQLSLDKSNSTSNTARVRHTIQYFQQLSFLTLLAYIYQKRWFLR